MEVICYKRAKDLLGWLIRWWTWGPYSHCELRFSDGMCFSSSWVRERRGILGIRAGTRFKKIEPDPGKWDRWRIDISAREELAIRKWCEMESGKPYDVWGILGFVFGKDMDAPHAWYCSEICSRALSVFGIHQFPRKVSPNKLASIMRSRPGIFQPISDSE